MLRPHTRNARWHPINSVKAKSPMALSPLVSVCVCVGGDTYVPLSPSQIGLEFQRIPYDLKNIVLLSFPCSQPCISLSSLTSCPVSSCSRCGQIWFAVDSSHPFLDLGALGPCATGHREVLPYALGLRETITELIVFKFSLCA